MDIGRCLTEYLDKYATGFEPIYNLCKPETGTSRARMLALYASTNYVIDANIPGDLIECGVWRGGSAMLMMSVLVARGDQNRRVWLYDTFEGMTPATERDVDILGMKASDMLEAEQEIKDVSSVWSYASLDIVMANISKTGFPLDRVEIVRGPVEQTIPGRSPSRIGLLRLDTDWYDSTLHEMVHFYPRLSKEGVLIIDDYGHWQGCREAIDQYFQNDLSPLYLHEIDYTCRAALKSAQM